MLEISLSSSGSWFGHNIKWHLMLKLLLDVTLLNALLVQVLDELLPLHPVDERTDVPAVSKEGPARQIERTSCRRREAMWCKHFAFLTEYVQFSKQHIQNGGFIVWTEQWTPNSLCSQTRTLGSSWLVHSVAGINHFTPTAKQHTNKQPVVFPGSSWSSHIHTTSPRSCPSGGGCLPIRDPTINTARSHTQPNPISFQHPRFIFEILHNSLFKALKSQTLSRSPEVILSHPRPWIRFLMVS